MFLVAVGEMSVTIAYLGPPGTFTHEAAQQLFSESSLVFKDYSSIPDVLSAAEQEESFFAVVPVENAIEGAVHSTWDWLVHHVHLPIRGELAYPIVHNLLVHPKNAGRDWRFFTEVWSHPQALAQCRLFLRETLPHATWRQAESTARAAEMVKSHPDLPRLAIGTKNAAKRNGLVVLKQAIHDYANNFTRFVVAGKRQWMWRQAPCGWKTSLQVTLPSDYPGALYQVLAAFSWRKINLCHIESRPTKTGLGNYYFLIDAELPADHVLMRGAIEEVGALGCTVRVLGSYPCFRVETVGPDLREETTFRKE
jgi:prephenate dehydratase